MEADFEKLRGAIKAAHMPDEARHSMTWCIDQLPPLYQQFADTYESRFADAIRRLTKGMLKVLAEAKVPKVAEVLRNQLQALHERLGLHGLDIAEPVPAVVRRRVSKKVT